MPGVVKSPRPGVSVVMTCEQGTRPRSLRVFIFEVGIMFPYFIFAGHA